MPAVSLHKIEVSVSDLPAALRFLRDLLGIPQLSAGSPQEPELMLGSTVIQLKAQSGGGGALTTCELTVNVDNLAAVVGKLSGNENVQFRSFQRPGGGTSFIEQRAHDWIAMPNPNPTAPAVGSGGLPIILRQPLF